MDIEFLELSPDSCPVKDFLLITPIKHRKKILRNLELIEKYPVSQSLSSGILEKIAGFEKHNLYEFKTRFQNSQYRILCYLDRSKLFLLHAFIKKSPKIPQKEIDTAIKRIKNITTII